MGTSPKIEWLWVVVAGLSHSKNHWHLFALALRLAIRRIGVSYSVIVSPFSVSQMGNRLISGDTIARRATRAARFALSESVKQRQPMGRHAMLSVAFGQHGDLWRYAGMAVFHSRNQNAHGVIVALVA